jgi:phosphoribosylglycinamide formyltransferase-1
MNGPSPDVSLPIAVLISGGGTTLKNLLDQAESGQLPVQVTLVVSSNPNAGGLQYARDADIPVAVVQPEQFDDPAEFSRAVFDACRKAAVELAVMGGFLKHVSIPTDFENRVMNIHPGLIPAFCGQGYYGLRVHQAVLDYGAKVSGCTVHFVDNVYDHGPIILQRVVSVEEGDTAETLQRRVFEQECAAYPEAIRLFASGRLAVVDRRVKRARDGRD